MRSECRFFHPIRLPAMRNMQGFHWDQITEPPIAETLTATAATATTKAKMPAGVSVIVLNKKMTTKGLSQSLKEMVL